MTMPDSTLSPLYRADGSATFSLGGYTVIAGVNGPVEVQRRDELPEEAAIEVNVRPAVGVGSPKERHLESIIHSSLKHIILTRNHPRTLVQITLQILRTPEDESLVRPSCHLPSLPALLQASVLALLDARIALSKTFHAASVCISSEEKVILNPEPKAISSARSIHVFAFTSKGELLLAESEGDFDMDEWDLAHDEARTYCLKSHPAEGEMDIDREKSLQAHVEEVINTEVEKERRWRAER